MLHLKFKNIAELHEAFSSEQQCIDYLESFRWNGKVISPFDSKSKVYQCNKNIYKCRNSGKYFNVKTNTIFHNTKIPLLKWFLAIWILTSKNRQINSVSLSKEIGVTQKTAWYMIKRIKSYLDRKDPTFARKNNRYPLKTEKYSVVKATNTEPTVEKLPLLQWLQLMKKQN